MSTHTRWQSMKHEAHCSSALYVLQSPSIIQNTGYRIMCRRVANRILRSKWEWEILCSTRNKYTEKHVYFLFSFSSFSYAAEQKKLGFFNTFNILLCVAVAVAVVCSGMDEDVYISCSRNIQQRWDATRLHVNVLRELANKIGNIFHLVAGGDGGYLSIFIPISYLSALSRFFTFFTALRLWIGQIWRPTKMLSTSRKHSHTHSLVDTPNAHTRIPRIHTHSIKYTNNMLIYSQKEKRKRWKKRILQICNYYYYSLSYSVCVNTWKMRAIARRRRGDTERTANKRNTTHLYSHYVNIFGGEENDVLRSRKQQREWISYFMLIPPCSCYTYILLFPLFFLFLFSSAFGRDAI